MPKFTALVVPLLLMVALVSCSDQTTEPVSTGDQATVANNGFDMYGYNYTARIFNGILDGADRTLDGKYWGDPYYANDKLVMKWTTDWDRGNDEEWGNPPYATAWTTNHYNGKVQNGTGEVWHYKIVWVGTELQNSTYWVAGGYAIWGQFEVIFSHGSDANEHFWDVHATPAGLGF